MPLINEKNAHFSFAGLKSAVANIVSKHRCTERFKKDMSASFQRTINEIIFIKTRNAIKEYKSIIKSKKDLNIVVAGGVAANKSIRQSLTYLGREEGCKFLFPSIKYCTDNGAMIALAGIERFERNKFNKLNFKPRPRWPLDKNAVFMKGKDLLTDKVLYKIGIIGGGAWGTALANIIAKKEKIILWAKKKCL